MPDQSLDLDALERLIAFVRKKQAKHLVMAQRRDALEHWDSAEEHNADATEYDEIVCALARLRAAEVAARISCPDCDHGIRGGAPCDSCLGVGTVTVWERLAWADAQYDDVASAYAALQHEAEEARDAWQARIAELEAQPSPGLAVDLAAFLNLTGEAVADALRDLGYRLIVERDPSAPDNSGGLNE